MSGIALTLRAALAAGFLLTATPVAAQALMSADEVTRELAERFGVEVLRVERTELESGPAYLVTVMQPGGNSNSAFMVSTLAVDARTGALIPSFKYRPADEASSAGPAQFAVEADGRAIRRETFRN